MVHNSSPHLIPTGMLSQPTTEIIHAFDMLTARYRVVPAYKLYAYGGVAATEEGNCAESDRDFDCAYRIHFNSRSAESAWSQPGAYQAPQSRWNDGYQPPKSQWSSPKTYRAPKSAWSTNGSRQPAKRQAPQSWWTDPGHQDPPTSAWDR